MEQYQFRRTSANSSYIITEPNNEKGTSFLLSYGSNRSIVLIDKYKYPVASMRLKGLQLFRHTYKVDFPNTPTIKTKITSKLHLTCIKGPKLTSNHYKAKVTLNGSEALCGWEYSSAGHWTLYLHLDDASVEVASLDINDPNLFTIKLMTQIKLELRLMAMISVGLIVQDLYC